jgi:hypothetical protein
MSEENKAVVRQFFAEVINGGNLDRADEHVTADYVEHQHLPSPPLLARTLAYQVRKRLPAARGSA